MRQLAALCLTGLLCLTVGCSKAEKSSKAEKKKDVLKGIDVSHFQGEVNWTQVKKGESSFAIAKCTGGIAFVDPQFKKNWGAMRDAGITRGAYHFLQTLGELGPGDLPPFLDVEISDGEDKNKIIQDVLAWLKAVEKKLGRKTVIYTDVSFGKEYLFDPRLKDYKLWIADYISSDSPQLPKERRGEGWSFWQYSQSGKVEGVQGDVDLDRFNGTEIDLAKFISESKI
jgi:lysozyme